MLNIENYDQWAAVCDDDDLIKELYDSGVRPGTSEFEELLGEPSGDGKPIGFKEFLLVIAGLFVPFLPFLLMWGLFKLIKFAVKKVVGFVKKKISERKVKAS